MLRRIHKIKVICAPYVFLIQNLYEYHECGQKGSLNQLCSVHFAVIFNIIKLVFTLRGLITKLIIPAFMQVLIAYLHLKLIWRDSSGW